MPPARWLASREQSRAEGLRPPAVLGGWAFASLGGFRLPAQQRQESWGRGPSRSRAPLAWVCSSPRPGRAMAGPSWKSESGWEGKRRRGSGAPAGRAGPELGARCAPPTPPSGPPPPPSSGPRTFRRARHRCPRLAAAITDSACLRNIPRKCEAEFRGGGGRGTAGKPQERAATGSPSVLPGFLPLPPERRCEERGGWGEPQQVVKEAWQRARKEADEV